MPQYQTYTPAVPAPGDILAFYQNSAGLMKTTTFSDFSARVYDLIALNFAAASLFPNIAPGPGQVLIGNPGGTAYQAATVAGDVQLDGSGNAVIQPNSVSYAKMQETSAPSVLLGRGSLLGPGVVREIDLGNGLLMIGTTLHATAGIGNVSQASDATQAGKVFVSAGLNKVQVESPVKLSSTDGTMYGFRNKVFIKPADEVLVKEDSGAVISNEGAGPMPMYTLPIAEPGLTYTFIVQDNAGIRVKAAGVDTVRIGAGVTSGGGTARTSAIGDTLSLVATNSLQWFATASRGTFLFT